MGGTGSIDGSAAAGNSSTTQRWVLALTSVASFMVALDALVVTTALTAIRLALHASVAELQRTVNAYILTFAVLLMTAAALGDRFGRPGLAVGGGPVVGGAIAQGAGLAVDLLA